MKGLFIDRDRELEALESEIRGEGLRIAVVYGRRRIGKTWLSRMLLSRLGGIYLFVPEGGRENLLQRFAGRLKGICRGLMPRSWEHVLSRMAECAAEKGGLLVVADEFQRLGGEFASQLQLLADERRFPALITFSDF